MLSDNFPIQFLVGLKIAQAAPSDCVGAGCKKLQKVEFMAMGVLDAVSHILPYLSHVGLLLCGTSRLCALFM